MTLVMLMRLRTTYLEERYSQQRDPFVPVGKQILPENVAQLRKSSGQGQSVMQSIITQRTI